MGDKAMAKAVARIQAGESTAAIEAQRLGKHSRTVERRVAAAKKLAGQSAVSGDAVPPAAAPVSGAQEGLKKPAPALAAALAAAGEKPPAGAPLEPTPADLTAARVDQAQFCIDTLSQFKMAVGGAVVTFKYSPPLDLGEKDVQRLLQIGPMASAAVRANVEKLYPTLVKLMAGPGVIYGALALDGLFMIMGLHSLATSRGWVKPDEKAKPPTRETYAEQLKPKAAPPAPPAKAPEGPPKKGAETIVDAPLPQRVE